MDPLERMQLGISQSEATVEDRTGLLRSLDTSGCLPIMIIMIFQKKTTPWKMSKTDEFPGKKIYTLDFLGSMIF